MRTLKHPLNHIQNTVFCNLIMCTHADIDMDSNIPSRSGIKYLLLCEYINYSTIQGSPRADIKAERVGVVLAEFVTTSIDFLPTSKLKLTVKAEGAALPKGPGENTAIYIQCVCSACTCKPQHSKLERGDESSWPD